MPDPGYILGFLGLVLLVVSNWARGRRRRLPPPHPPVLVRLDSWGSLAAFGCLLSALLLFMWEK